MASPKSLPSWLVALGAGLTSVPVVGPWINVTVHHRYLGPTVVAGVALAVTGLGKLAAGGFGHVRPRLAAWLELLLVRWFSRFGPWYRRVVLTDSRSMGREGFGGLVARGLDLDRVYVDVSLVSRAPRSASPHLVRDGRADGDRRQDITSFLNTDGPSVLVVLGGPGSGKSTLLRRIARQAYLNPGARGRRTPLFLALREHAATIAADPAIRLSTLVGRAKAPLLTGGTVPGLLAPEPRRVDALVDWFEGLLLAGRCVVLLDGLDEVATEEERSAIVTWANTQILRYHGNDYLLSSRPDGYRAGGLDDADVLEVEPFTTDQVNAFVVDAYDALASREAAQRAADLSRQLGAASRLRPLTRNPLLLTMLFFVHRDHGSLPASRLELYRQICRTVLEDRQKDKRIVVPLPIERSEALLSGLALAMTREGSATTWTRAQVLDQLRPQMVALPVAAESFLDLVGLHGLFVESGIGRYAFTHRTFQEYLSAVALAASAPDELPVNDPWWHETLLFYALITGPDQVVRACLARDTVTAWNLAFDCAEDAPPTRPLDRGLAARLELLLVTPMVGDAYAAQRRLFAGVMATRHLRNVVHTARDQAICARLVPATLYRMFQLEALQDMSPDPAMVILSSGSTDKPVRGVLGGRAAEFVEWVNAVTGGTSCRLPTGDEVADGMVQELLSGAWSGGTGDPVGPPSLWTSEPGARRPALWTSPRLSHPWAVPRELVRADWDADLADPEIAIAGLVLVRVLSDLRILAHAEETDDASVWPVTDALLGNLGLGFALSMARRVLPQSARSETDALKRISTRVWDAYGDIRSQGWKRFGDTVVLDLLSAYAEIVRLPSPLAAVLAPDLEELGQALAHPVSEEELDAVRTRKVDRLLGLARVGAMGHVTAGAVEAGLLRASRPEGHVNTPEQLLSMGFLWGMGRAVDPVVESRTVDLEDLADITRQACLDLRALAAARTSSPWVHAATARLDTMAWELFTWKRSVWAEMITQIRVGALCLAAEAEQLTGSGHHGPGEDLPERFRAAAAGASLLQRRLDPATQPAEAILLAVD